MPTGIYKRKPFTEKHKENIRKAKTGVFFHNEEERKLRRKESVKKYRLSEKGKATQKKYNHSEKGNENYKKYSHSEKGKKYYKEYAKEKYNSDIQVKLRNIIRSRFRLALKGGFKTGSAVKALGCSIEELKIYIERQFQIGMSWDNHGKFGWHIDHKIPLSSVDLTDEEQFQKVCHFTNLKPLWWRENLVKGGRVIIN